MRFSWSLVIFIARCDASWPQLPDTALCDGTLGLFQRKLGRQERRAVQTEKPWEKRVYLVGTCHKVGSQLLRNVMEWTFDALGAKESCQYGGMGVPITFYTPEHTDCAEHPSSIRFDNHIDGDTISELRNLGGILVLWLLVYNLHVLTTQMPRENRPFLLVPKLTYRLEGLDRPEESSSGSVQGRGVHAERTSWTAEEKRPTTPEASAV